MKKPEGLRCCYCNRLEKELNEDDDLRPYGPGGQPTCYECAMSTKERRETTDRAFYAALDKIEADGGIAVIGAGLYGVQDLRKRDA